MAQGFGARVACLLVISVGLFVSGAVAHSADITWGGIYRVEADQIQDSELSSANTDKAYVLHHLILNPKMTLGDGLNIYSRLDILNSTAYGINNSHQVTSVAGDVLGDGPGTPVSTTTPYGPQNGTDSNSSGSTQAAGAIAITELYLSWSHEFGQFIVGRVPLQFGLGVAYSAGNGLFDHYITTKDLVAYKLVFGNLYVMPIKAKVNEGALNTFADVDDYMVQVGYDNPDTELSLGFMYDLHVVTGNDSPVGPSGGAASGGAPFLGSPAFAGPQARTGSYTNTLMSFFFSEKPLPSLRASVEFDLAQGSTGIQWAPGASTGLNAYGLATELAWLPHDNSKWSGKLKFGLATGDDPGTYDVDEGFQFNRNYQIAQLMFHQPLGQADILRTGLVRNTNIAPSAQLDTEAVSNAIYIAPSLNYQLRDNISFMWTLVYARLNKDPMGPGANTAMDLGYEGDFSVTWKPMERLTWVSGIGALLPGNAWRGATSAYNNGLSTTPADSFENKMAFGLESKAAISF